MREILADIMAAYEADEPVAMATVVRTWRSAPRPAGASMIVTQGGEAVGSVSGGCVEGALYDVGQEVLAGGPTRLETYGVSDDDAFAVGLTCGGILDVFVEQVSPQTWPELPGIVASVERSRTTLMLVTNAFAKSEWCMYELFMAQHQLIAADNDSVVLALMEDIEPMNLNPRLRLLLQRRVHLQWTDDAAGQRLFWERLKTMLRAPVQSLIHAPISEEETRALLVR